jgi:hypothetical protein
VQLTGVARLLTIVVLLAGPSAGNVLLNPSFEVWSDDSTPAVWRVEVRTKTAVLHEADTVHSGAGACRLTRLVAGTGDNKGILERVPVRPNAMYRYSVWCQDNSPEISLGVVISWRTQDSTYISSTSAAYSTDSPNWQQVSDSAAAPADAAFADFILRTYGATGAPAGNRVLVDDASMESDSIMPDSLRIWFFQDSLGARLIDFFDDAGTSIDYCCYNSSRMDVALALVNAHNRGIRLRIITDNTRVGRNPDPWVALLRAAGITVWSDSISHSSSNYMHNKFVIRDLADADSTNDWMWVASYNPNEGETHADCAMEIPEPALARAYLDEFNQMWGDTGMTPNPDSARFHEDKRDRLSTHEFSVNGSRARLYFAPNDRVVDTITALVSQAQREVGFAINAFTFDNLGAAMLGLFNDGKRVFGTFDRANGMDSASEYWHLRPAHVPVKIDSFPYGNGTVHEKIMVIDSTITVTGSANWSANANFNNDENTLMLYDSTIAGRFMAEIVARYIEAGGTYPPAVAEPASAVTRPHHFLRSPCLSLSSLPAGTVLFDAAGRTVMPGRVRPGVYYTRTPGSPTVSAVLIR